MSYIDGFIVPLPKGKEDEYRGLAETFAKKAQAQGALGSVEAIGDDLQPGHTTDFFKAVKAEDGENVVFSFIVWPDKATRDRAGKRSWPIPKCSRARSRCRSTASACSGAASSRW